MATENQFSAPQQPSRPVPAVRPSFRQLWQVPVFLAGLLTLAAVYVTRPLWYDPELRHLERDLALGRQMLEEPQAALNDVPAVLVDALNRIDRLPGRAGEAHFLLGSAYLALADRLPAERAQDLQRQACLQLEQAEARGVPEADRALLAYRLGKAYYQTGGDPARTILYLNASIEQVGEDRSEGYGMLAQTYLRLPERDLKSALAANEKQLQQPIADEKVLAPARLLRGELLLELRDREAARKVLARIGPGAAPALVSQARLLRARSFQEEDAWAEAAPLWEGVLADSNEKQADRNRILYYLGWCYQNLHRTADAIRLWEQVAETGGETAQAACLRLGEVRLEGGQARAAVPWYERALAGITRPEQYHNTLVDLARARQFLEAGCRAQRDAGDFENARNLARFHARLAPPEQAQLLLAQVTEAWATAQRDKALGLKDREAAQRGQEEAQLCFREAGGAYEAAARVARASNSRIEWLWHAGQDYLQGQDFAHAVSVFEGLLKADLPLERQPEACYRLGEAHQAVAHRAAAAEAFHRCIAYDSPFAYRARFQLAMAESEHGHPTEAEDALRQNLELMSAEPDREAQEKSLYALADLLYQRRDYRAAMQRWELALNLYPTNPTASLARYRLGDCYRHLADVELQGLALERPFAAHTQGHFRKQFKVWLEKAGANYQKLIDDLEARQTTGPISEAEATLLRQVQFALAACRFDEGNYDEAIRLFDKLARRYENQVEGLRAVRDLYGCFVAMAPSASSLKNAEATLQRAIMMLNNLDESAFKGLPESEGRAQWEQWHKKAVDDLRKLDPRISP
jgi:tetratricopeptide (TPR) repeat protein